MYEYTQGSGRLVSVLSSYREDPATVAALAKALRYEPEQLRQDIQALDDYYTDHRRAEREQAE